MEKDRCTAVILAAGSGSRMRSSVAKQFLELKGKPLIFYALNTVERSEIIDRCILVTGAEHLQYVRDEIVERFGFQKVRAIIEGGSERCFSVANAMRWLDEHTEHDGRERYVFIHDGARPFLSEELLDRTYKTVQADKACVAAVPAKDTIKVADSARFAVRTPDRKTLWQIQTPQVFEQKLIVGAYASMMEEVLNGNGSVNVTDDAGVVERYTDARVRLVEGSYCNMKVTTPEDMVIAEALLQGGESIYKS